MDRGKLIGASVLMEVISDHKSELVAHSTDNNAGLGCMDVFHAYKPTRLSLDLGEP